LINLCNNILFTGVALTLHKLWHSHCTSCGTHTAQVVALTLHKLWHSHCTSCGTHTAQVVALTLHKLWHSHCTSCGTHTAQLALYRCDTHTHTAQEPASLFWPRVFWFDAVMSLQFIHDHSFVCGFKHYETCDCIVLLLLFVA